VPFIRGLGTDLTILINFQMLSFVLGDQLRHFPDKPFGRLGRNKHRKWSGTVTALKKYLFRTLNEPWR